MEQGPEETRCRLASALFQWCHTGCVYILQPLCAITGDGQVVPKVFIQDWACRYL